MGKKRLNEDQIKELISLHLTNKYTSRELGIIFDRNQTTIIDALKRRGYHFRKASEVKRKYPVDKHYFNNINTPEKAYVLGLLYADGSNNEQKGLVTIVLKENDHNILQKISDLIQPLKPVKFFEGKTNICHLQFACKEISQDLAKWGCVQNKTFKITFPDWLEESYYSHFMRGYIDGDGHISKAVKNMTVNFAGTNDFCLFTREYIQSKLNLHVGHQEVFKERLHSTHINILRGKKSIIFLDWLYKDATIFLDRKYQRYIDFKNHLEHQK